MDYVLLGQNISKLRRKNHLTQEQLAERADVSTVFISQIETAARRPSLETLYKIASVLDTTIDTLIGETTSQVHMEEFGRMMQNKSCREVLFVLDVVREMCAHMENGIIQ